MTPNQIKRNLNKLVHYKSESLHIDGDFKLSGIIISPYIPKKYFLLIITQFQNLFIREMKE